LTGRGRWWCSQGRMVSCGSTVVGFRALAIAGILSRGVWPEVALLQGMRALGLAFAGGEFSRSVGRYLVCTIVRWNDVLRCTEQLLAHGVAIENGHDQILAARKLR